MDGGTFVVWGNTLYLLLEINNRMGRFATVTGGAISYREFYEAIETLRPYYIQLGDTVVIKMPKQKTKTIEIVSINRNNVGQLRFEYFNEKTKASGIVLEKDFNKLYLQHIQD